MKALDLYCGAGGMSEGLRRAGFDVTGVDINPQPHHKGGHFIQADVLEVLLDLAFLRSFDFIHASPPCQAYSSLRHLQAGKVYPDLIPATRASLLASKVPYSIENVEGAPLGSSGFLTMLCGTMFGLQTPDGRAEIRRHRLFETSFSIPLRPACQHGDTKALTVVGHTPVDNTRPRARAISVCGPHGPGGVSHARRRADTVVFSGADARAAMGIDWMPMKYLSQAIPPAYAEWIGRQALAYLEATGAALRQLPPLCPECCGSAIAAGLASLGSLCEGCSFFR